MGHTSSGNIDSLGVLNHKNYKTNYHKNPIFHHGSGPWLCQFGEYSDFLKFIQSQLNRCNAVRFVTKQ